MKTKLMRRNLPSAAFPALARFLCPVLTAALFVPSHAAPPADAPPATDISQDTTNTDGVHDSIERRKRLDALFPGWKAPQWLESCRDSRDALLKRIHLDIGASYDVAGVAVYGDGDPDSGFSGDLTVNGMWLLFGKKWDRPLDLRFRVRYRHAIGGRAASEVAGVSGGVLWNMIDGFSDAGFEIPDFQLVQHLPRHNLEIRYGQMTIDSQFDRHGLRSSKQAFFNRAFSSNPAVAFPRFGAGATLLWKPEGRGFDLTIGTTTVQGTQNGDQVDFSLGSSNFFSAVQFGRDFKLRDNPARIQAMLWHSDAVEDEDTPEGEGVSLTFEHWLAGSKDRLFVRAAWADGAASDTDRMLAAGFATERCENDLFGVAVGTGRGSSGDHDWQAVIETFYRRQIGPSFQVTPEAQLIFGSGLDEHPVRLVFGLRGELVF